MRTHIRVVVRQIAARAVLAIVALVSAGCSDMTGPSSGPARFVLTSIGTAPAPTVNIFDTFLAGDVAEGAYWYLVADTLSFHPDGRGERHGAFRTRPKIGTPLSPLFEPYVEFHGAFRWVDRGGWLEISYLTDCSRYCFAGLAEGALTRARWGALRREWDVEAMHYEPVSRRDR